MGVVLKMSDKGSKRRGETPPEGKVLAHPNANLRDIEKMLRYVKTLDERRGRR